MTTKHGTERMIAGWFVQAEDSEPLDSKPAAFKALLTFAEVIARVGERLADPDDDMIEVFDAAWFSWLTLAQCKRLMTRLKTGGEAHAARLALDEQAKDDAFADMIADVL